MNALKNHLSNKAELYQFFFLIFKITNVVTAILLLKFSFDLGSQMPFEMNLIWITLSSLFFIALQFAAAVVAQKMIREENSLGLVIGLMLALMTVVSILFPVGLLGVYSLLNKKFRDEKLLKERPLWLNSFYQQIEKWTSPAVSA